LIIQRALILITPYGTNQQSSKSCGGEGVEAFDEALINAKLYLFARSKLKNYFAASFPSFIDCLTAFCPFLLQFLKEAEIASDIGVMKPHMSVTNFHPIIDAFIQNE
jgi:hypothetical protein